MNPMNRSPYSEQRVLAIDPTVRGLGYAVIEGGTRLVDWGGRRARYGKKNRHSVGRVAELIARYEPDALVIEDCAARESRRCPRVERLVAAIERLAASKGIALRKISRATVEGAFSEAGASTKHEIATAIAGRFPQLAVWLPPVRKRWMNETYRVGIFDAMALGLTFFSLEEEQARAA